MSIFSGDLTEMIFYTKRELMKLSSPRSVFIKEGTTAWILFNYQKVVRSELNSVIECIFIEINLS